MDRPIQCVNQRFGAGFFVPVISPQSYASSSPSPPKRFILVVEPLDLVRALVSVLDEIENVDLPVAENDPLVVILPTPPAMSDIYGQDRVIECRIETTFSTQADGQGHMRSVVLRHTVLR